jgi:prolyl oligopeptidase
VPNAPGRQFAHPPTTRQQPLVEHLLGRPVADPFRWLEDELSPEVQGWMAAQDAYARAHLAALPRREALAARLTELYAVDSVGLPVKRGGRLFYTRTRRALAKAIVCWREGAEGEERVLLDPNTWSTDGSVSLGVWVPSWDGRKVVFAERPNAADEAILHVLDVDSGRRLELEVIEGAKYASPSWLPDSKAFQYEWLPPVSTLPVAQRPGSVELRLHRLGTAPATDELLHGPTGDPRVFLSQGLSRDGRYRFAFVSRGWSENDIFFQKTHEGPAWRPLILGSDATYGVEVLGDTFYVFTDEGAPNKQVFRVDPERPERADWVLVIPEDPQIAREGLSIVGGHLAISGLRQAASVLELFTLEGRAVRAVELPGLGTASGLLGTAEDDEAYFAFSGFVSPPVVFRTSVSRGTQEVWARAELRVEASRYSVRQVWYPSKDGTPISMFIVAANDVKLEADNPVLLGGYGGFNLSVRSAWTGFIHPWLEAGGVYAAANLRGGGEYGKRWHDAGKRGLKQNVFDDFIAAAEYLIAQRWTRPGRLAVRGGSNGGLLVGAVMTQRPELFGAVSCAVPLLDMARYHRFGSGKTWIPEYGDPEDPADLPVLLAYSPYHQPLSGRLPPLLMRSADHDDRVDPFHARKFVARVQAAQGLAWLRIEAQAGHGGADLVEKAVEASVDELAFLLSMLSVA